MGDQVAGTDDQHGPERVIRFVRNERSDSSGIRRMTTECEIDLRPGGKFRTVMRGPDGTTMDNTGCYLEV
jgi:hypothetical protein